MLRRKIIDQLSDWRADSRRKPVIVKGCRQCGKTYAAKAFAEANYDNVVYVNFFENPEAKDIFAGSLDIEQITMMASALLGSAARFVPGKTVLILDEIQECPQARTALKFFSVDGRYDVIGTGSLLGVAGYGETPASIPVGYETVIDMHPLDFEEFCWASGITDQIVALLRNCLEAERPVPPALHARMRSLLLEYVVVGGMPDAVQSFVMNHDMRQVLRIQRDIVRAYEDDMVKYAPTADKPLIKQCFQSIPRQLAKENKKFQYSLVKKGSTAARFAGSLQWVEDAGITVRCRNLSITELPLDGNALDDQFKVYMADTGLFVSMLEDGTQFDILNGNLFGYKGAIFENLMADIFSKMGRRLYYFRKDSGLELDFVIRYKGECVLVEVKANDGNAKSVKTVLKHPEKYHVNSAIKLADLNVGRTGEVLTLPLYLAFLLTER